MFRNGRKRKYYRPPSIQHLSTAVDVFRHKAANYIARRRIRFCRYTTHCWWNPVIGLDNTFFSGAARLETPAERKMLHSLCLFGYWKNFEIY